MGQDIVGSRMKPEDGYGQNGSAAPSSDTRIGETNITGIKATPDNDAALASVARKGVTVKGSDTIGLSGQERPISDAPIAPAHGMKPANERTPLGNTAQGSPDEPA